MDGEKKLHLIISPHLLIQRAAFYGCSNLFQIDLAAASFLDNSASASRRRPSWTWKNPGPYARALSACYRFWICRTRAPLCSLQPTWCCKVMTHFCNCAIYLSTPPHKCQDGWRELLKKWQKWIDNLVIAQPMPSEIGFWGRFLGALLMGKRDMGICEALSTELMVAGWMCVNFLMTSSPRKCRGQPPTTFLTHPT